MSEDTEWTIGKLLEWTKEYLAKQGSDSARLDAEVLLAHARKCQRIELYTAFDEVASQQVRDSFRALVKRRAEGTPVAYLVEHREFYSLPFYVNSSVLIPRPETEFLVIRLLDIAKQQTESKEYRVVDVGTGSGILAICAALYLPSSTVVAIDASPEALEVARKNAVQHNVADRIEFREGDLLSGCDPAERFDFVILDLHLPDLPGQAALEAIPADVPVMVPVRVIQLDEADPSLDQTPRQQTVIGK